MSSVSVTNRINLGFAILTCVIVCLAGVAYLAVSQLGSSYQDYRSTTRQTTLITNIVEDMFEARIAALKYRSNPSDATASDVRGNIDEILQEARSPLLDTATDSVQSQIVKVASLAEAYVNGFDEASRTGQEIRDLGRQLELTGQAIAASIEAVESVTRPGQSFSDILAESTARTAALNTLGAVTNGSTAFVDSGLPVWLETSQTNFDDLRFALAELGTTAKSSPGEPWADEVVAHIEDGLTALTDFEQTFSRVAENWTFMNEINRGTLDRVGPEMRITLENAFDAVIAQQDELGPAGQRVVDLALRSTPVVGVIAFILAVSIAFLVGRWITIPLRRLAEMTQELASGNTSVAITGAEHAHELGQMARSLEVFKDTIARDHAAAERTALETAEQQMVVSLLSDGLDALANGQLDQRLHQKFKETYEPLRLNFNATLDRLEKTMREVVLASQNVENGVADINNSSQNLSERTANQAATLEQSAAALDELTISIKSSAAQSQEVDDTVQAARTEAQNSEEVVNHAVQAMGRIEHSSQQISKITDVISDISFQTNLLALNAGVEAARAGEAGRGFAVVASEVRALAQRSSEAAREVSDLIGKSSAEVTEGTRLVNKAGDALGQIVVAVDQVSRLITEITSSAVEQASGLTEINTGVNMLDEVTQKNASMVETSFVQGQNLVTEARRLESLVQQFQLSNKPSSISKPDVRQSA